MPHNDELEMAQAILRANASPKGTRSAIEALHAAVERASRDHDHTTHAALHVIEMKLREARLVLLEAEKVVKGEALELVRTLLEVA